MKIYKISQVDFQQRLRSLMPQFCQAAQKVYDEWDQDEEGIDLVLGSGGICQDIAEEISGVLLENGINAGTVHAEIGEQHVWTVAWENDNEEEEDPKPYNAYEIDIHPYTYESGGGYNWKKIQGVRFSPEDIVIRKTEDEVVDYIKGD